MLSAAGASTRVCEAARPTQCASRCCAAPGIDLDLYNCAVYDCASVPGVYRSTASLMARWRLPLCSSPCAAPLCTPWHWERSVSLSFQ
jgi:hypothetical protein